MEAPDGDSQHCMRAEIRRWLCANIKSGSLRVKHSLKIQPPVPLSGVIAVVGCDGSGKSTLTADLLAHFQKEGPCERVYLGQSSGNIATWIKGLPVVGVPVGRYLARKAERTHARKTAAPDIPAALVIFVS